MGISLVLTRYTSVKMDQLKGALNSFTGGNNEQTPQQSGQQQGGSSGRGFLGGLGDKFNAAAGGGRESEKNEDYPTKVSTSFKRNSSAKDLETTKVPLNRPKTSRSATSFATNTSRPAVLISHSRTSPRLRPPLTFTNCLHR